MRSFFIKQLRNRRLQRILLIFWSWESKRPEAYSIHHLSRGLSVVVPGRRRSAWWPAGRPVSDLSWAKQLGTKQLGGKTLCKGELIYAWLNQSGIIEVLQLRTYIPAAKKKAKQQWQSQRRDFGLWQNRLPWLEFSLSRPHKAVIEGKFFARIAIIIEDQSQGRRSYVEGQRARATCPLSFFRNRSKTCSFKKTLDYVLISPYPLQNFRPSYGPVEPLRWCKRTCGVYVYTFWKCSTYILPYVYWEPKPSRTKLCILVPIDHPQCAQRIFIETSRALMAHQACQSRCRSQCLNELEASWPAYMQAGMPGKASSILSKLKSRWIFLRQADAMLRRVPPPLSLCWSPLKAKTPDNRLKWQVIYHIQPFLAVYSCLCCCC